MPSRPRKILFIAGDQWRAECLSAAGHKLALTPNLDALAQDGVRFAKHFGQASPCGPARSSLLTGLYLQTHRSGRNGTPLDERFTNLAREVRKAGLRPFLFGYTDTSADPRGRAPDDPALHTYEGVMPGFDIGCQLPEDFKPWRAYLAAKGYPVYDDVWDYFEPQGGKIGAAALYREEDSPTAFLADRIIENIKVRRDENWCFYLSILAPHPPLIASGRWNEMIQPRDVEMPQRFATWQEEQALHPFHAWRVENTFLNRKWLGKACAGQRLDEAMVRQIRATYYALIRESDHHLGRIFQALKDSGQWDDTLIISTCDHGEMLGDHWQVGKETVFDKAFHLPLVVRNPDSQAKGGRGRVVESFSESIDLLPTVLDWLGQPIPPALDGLALTPFLKGEQPDRWRKFAHFEYDFRDPAHGIPEKALGISSDLCYAAALRGERWKYVHFAGLPAMLFDLQNDPHEMKNLAGDPAHQSVMLAMAQELLSHRMVHADRTLTSHFIDEAGLHQHHEPRY